LQLLGTFKHTGHIIALHPTHVLLNLLQPQCLHSSTVSNIASDLLYVPIFTDLNRTRKFDAHDPYHPYDPYFNLDLHISVGKVFAQECKECYKVEDPKTLRFTDIFKLKQVAFLLTLYFFIFLGFNIFYATFPIQAVNGVILCGPKWYDGLGRRASIAESVEKIL
jgi:hypothetical protein